MQRCSILILKLLFLWVRVGFFVAFQKRNIIYNIWIKSAFLIGWQKIWHSANDRSWHPDEAIALRFKLFNLMIKTIKTHKNCFHFVVVILHNISWTATWNLSFDHRRNSHSLHYYCEISSASPFTIYLFLFLCERSVLNIGQQ